MERPKISFPVEESFIRLQPSIAAEIGKDAAILLLYFIFILEGDAKYLRYEEQTNRYWVKKSLNNLTYAMFPFFKIQASENRKDNSVSLKELSFDAVKHKMRILLKVLVDDLELLFCKSTGENGNAGKLNWYSLNYEMLSALNGISVKWEYRSEIRRLSVKTDKKGVRLSHTSEGVRRENAVAHPIPCANLQDSCAGGRTHNTERIEKKENNIERASAALPIEAVELLEMINAL